MAFNLESWLSEQSGVKQSIPPYDVKSIVPGDGREWLITNGLGSFASGSISGANTRKYHGLFVASLQAPTARTLLFSRVDEYVNQVNISTNLWGPDNVSPRGCERLVAFSIYPMPTWVYELDAGYFVKQVVMLPSKQQVVLGYSWVAKNKGAAAEVDLHLLFNHRDFHGETHGNDDWRFQQQPQENGVVIKAFAGAPELHITLAGGKYKEEPNWYRGYYYPRETERGLGDREDAYHAGVLSLSLADGQSVVLNASLQAVAAMPSLQEVVRELIAHQDMLQGKAGRPESVAVKRLVQAADQFLVWRDSTNSQSVIAGYHWFNDWGRDSMISLPGLTLASGRHDLARSILSTFQSYLSEGMLPNNFPDAGHTPHYNTSDATLWWAWSLKKYLEASKDLDFVKAALPALESVVDWHMKGTRFNIRLDQNDGLVTGGADGVQLTWMDAKVGDFVVTPRRGKAVEISALWYNFLRTLEELHLALGTDGARFGEMAEKTRLGFRSFWNADAGCLFDVINEDGSKDDSVRPNQLLALSLRPGLLTDEQAKSMLAVVESELLTPRGLRSLSPKHRDYKATYGGGKASANQYDRDVTYHQGTVWGWLFGPWIDARINVFGRTEANVSLIRERLASVIDEHLLFEDGMGSVSEIFDGDSPHKARGCVAQAWSVAELLRVFSDYPELLRAEPALAAKTR